MPRPLVIALSLLTLAVLPGCRGGPEKPPPLKPYLGYFESMRPEASYVFATLKDKQQFDRDPQFMGFREYIANTGLRVLIHVPQMRAAPVAQATANTDEPEPSTRAADGTTRPLSGNAAPGEPQIDVEAERLVERIALGFELEEETTLTLRTDPTAPPASYARPSLTPGTQPSPAADVLPTSRPGFMTGNPTAPTPRDDSRPPSERDDPDQTVRPDSDFRTNPQADQTTPVTRPGEGPGGHIVEEPTSRPVTQPATQPSDDNAGQPAEGTVEPDAPTGVTQDTPDEPDLRRNPASEPVGAATRPS